MKTTVEIEDALLRDAKLAAREQNTTLRALIERGLRSVLAEPAGSDGPFRLRRVVFAGDGVRDEMKRPDGSWDWAAIRRAADEGRGG